MDSSSRLGQLLDVAYNIEYGAESNVQSSLNMLYLLGFAGQGQLRIFGKSNEKYHVRGGNDQIPARLGDALAGPGDDRLGARRDQAQRRWQLPLTFRRAATRTVTADRVVLALPFSILRGVDYSKAGFSTRQEDGDPAARDGDELEAPCPIRQTPLELARQPRRDLRGHRLPEHLGGDPRAAGNRGDPGRLHGRQHRRELRQRHSRRTRQQFLSQIEPVLPGITSPWNGLATIDYWTGYPWTKGSYSYWKVGQYTKFSGAEGEEQDGCHFAGEHTSIDFQGYLNGAVESGERAAGEILAALK